MWKYSFVPKSSNLVDVHMGGLRRKIDGPDEPPMIVTVHRKRFSFSVAKMGNLRRSKRDDGKRRVPLQR